MYRHKLLKCLPSESLARCVAFATVTIVGTTAQLVTNSFVLALKASYCTILIVGLFLCALYRPVHWFVIVLLALGVVLVINRML